MVYIYVHTHKYIYTCRETYILLYIHICSQIMLYIHIYIHTYSYLSQIHTYIYTYTYISHVHIYTDRCIYPYVQMYIHTCISLVDLYIHTHIYSLYVYKYIYKHQAYSNHSSRVIFHHPPPHTSTYNPEYVVCNRLNKCSSAVRTCPFPTTRPSPSPSTRLLGTGSSTVAPTG